MLVQAGIEVLEKRILKVVSVIDKKEGAVGQGHGESDARRQMGLYFGRNPFGNYLFVRSRLGRDQFDCRSPGPRVEKIEAQSDLNHGPVAAGFEFILNVNVSRSWRVIEFRAVIQQGFMN